MTKVILKKGREESLLKGHHSIFSGAFAECPEKANGDIFPIFSSANELVAHAFINTTPRTIWGRILLLEMKILSLHWKDYFLAHSIDVKCL